MQEQRHHIFSKLLRKPSAAIAMGVILCTCIIAIFAYQFAPDDTPYANNMIVELAAKQPGFSIDILKVPKTLQSDKANVAPWFSGTPNNYQSVPINDHWYSNNTLYVNHYIDDHIQDTLSYSFTTLLNDTINARSSIEHELITHKTFHLGTDKNGRDILSRLLVGSRVSLAVGLIAVILSITIGIILGSVAGYYGGVVDNIVMWIINILWAIPTLLLVFAITLTIGKGFWEIFVAIGLTMWVSAARLIRGQVMVIREMEYVVAAKALGIRNIRIIFRHILPNIAGPIMVIAASNFATAILIEAGLSFLGIGVQPPMPSWGLMIKEHYNFLLTNRPLLAIIPGIAIMVLVYAFNIIGNAMRDVLDVRTT